jgi:hypothetical protein
LNVNLSFSREFKVYHLSPGTNSVVKLVLTKNSGAGFTKDCFLLTRHQWLMPIILATQEAEIRRMEV